MKSKPIPTHYTSEDGGQWKEWNFLLIPSWYFLEAIVNLPAKHFRWQDERIYSLAFHDPINTPTYGFARWDCINGWTTTIEDVETMNDGV